MLVHLIVFASVLFFVLKLLPYSSMEIFDLFSILKSLAGVRFKIMGRVLIRK